MNAGVHLFTLFVGVGPALRAADDHEFFHGSFLDLPTLRAAPACPLGRRS